VDLLEYLGKVKTLVQRHETPPSKSPTDHALFDAWTSILKPRAARMTRRLSNLMERRRWEVDATGRALHLKEEHWQDAVGDLGSLYTELAGALAQYRTFQPLITQTRPLFDPRPYDGPVGGQYDLYALERNLLGKLHGGGVVWAHELAAYNLLLDHVHRNLFLQAQAIADWEQRQVERQEQLQSMLTRIQMGLESRRQLLTLQMLSVRMVTAALQATEEDRLRSIWAELSEGDPNRVAAEGMINGMRVQRLSAQSHTEAPNSEYGTILRRWLRVRGDVLKLLRATSLPPK
jgi:hypothetical protein